MSIYDVYMQKQGSSQTALLTDCIARSFIVFMQIPHKELYPQTLHKIIEEFVTRNGTDYGAKEASLDSKVKDVLGLLDMGRAQLLFDSDTSSVDIREV